MSKRLRVILVAGVVGIIAALIFARQPGRLREQAIWHREKSEEYYHEGNLDKARDELVASLRIDPSFHLARIDLATFYSMINRFDDGIALLDEGIKAYPDYDGFHYEKARLLYQTDRMEEIPALLNHYLQKHADETSVYLLLGLTYEHLKQWDQARLVWQRALERFPNDPVDFASKVKRAEEKSGKLK